MSAEVSAASLPRPLRAVTFDCWATLLAERDWPTAHARRVRALQDAALDEGREISCDRAGAAFDAAWNRHMRLWREGSATGARDVARWALDGLEIPHSGAGWDHLVQHFEEASHSSRVEALDGARETLLALREEGVHRALVCDTGLTPGRVVRRHLQRLGLLELLEGTAFSDEVGVPKPSPRAFAAALGEVGVDPEDALHVGDLRATDVAGARALGMTTVRIRAWHDDVSELPEADFVVDSHADLRTLLVRAGGAR